MKESKKTVKKTQKVFIQALSYQGLGWDDLIIKFVISYRESANRLTYIFHSI